MNKHICSITDNKKILYPKPIQAWCKSTLFNILANLQFGRLSIDNCGQLYEFGDLHTLISFLKAASAQRNLT
jgi:hypothetical protein